MNQVKEGKGRLRPGVDANAVIQEMFSNQDSNGDGKIIGDELKQTDEASEKRKRDEL